MAVVLHTRAAQECPFECHFYDDTEPPAFDLPVSQATCNRPISDHSGEHNSYFLSCDVPRATQEKPLFTQLSLKQNGQARLLGHPVSVQSGSGIQSSSERSGFGVCVKPTFKFFRAHQMVTFLEWYQHGGASHIFLYNHSWVHEVDDVIAQHVRNYPGSVTVFPFKFSMGETLPLGTDGGCWPHLGNWPAGQNLGNNLCLLEAYTRNLAFTASIDLDELLWIPKEDILLTEGWLLKHMNSQLQRKADMCSYQVRNTFTDTCEQFWKSGVLRKSATITPNGQRSKEIWVVDKVMKPAIHSVHDCAVGSKKEFADPRSLVMMHMRYGWGRDKFVEEAPEFAKLMRRFCAKPMHMSELARVHDGEEAPTKGEENFAMTANRVTLGSERSRRVGVLGVEHTVDTGPLSDRRATR